MRKKPQTELEKKIDKFDRTVMHILWIVFISFITAMGTTLLFLR